jgi:hypothetical protein
MRGKLAQNRYQGSPLARKECHQFTCGECQLKYLIKYLI